MASDVGTRASSWPESPLCLPVLRRPAGRPGVVERSRSPYGRDISVLVASPIDWTGILCDPVAYEGVFPSHLRACSEELFFETPLSPAFQRRGYLEDTIKGQAVADALMRLATPARAAVNP